MPYTDEPFGLKWLNNINPNALGITVSQLVWIFGSVVLTYADYRLLLSGDVAGRESGMVLAGMLLGAWTGKTIVGAVDSQNKRKLHPDAAVSLEAQERGKVAGAAAAVVIADKAAELKSTREHPVQQAGPVEPQQQQVNVITGDNPQLPAVQPLRSAPVDLGGQGQEWANDEKHEGLL